MKRSKKPVKAMVLICLALAALYVASTKSNTGFGNLRPLSISSSEINRIRQELAAAQMQLQQTTDKKEMKRLHAKIAALQQQLNQLHISPRTITPRPVVRS